MKAEKQLTAKEIAKLFVWKTETYKLGRNSPYDLRDYESMIEEYTNSKLKIIIETIENQKEKIAHCESDEEVWNDGLDRAIEIIKKEIRGKNLACWCPLLDKRGRKMPCHADVLLKIANE